MGYVPVDLSKEGSELTVEVLGEFRKAIVTKLPLYDPAGSKMRA